MVASAILTFQFAVSYWFPDFMGYSGYLVFGFLIGRFLGVQHPPVYDDRPLSTGRIAVGVLSIIVFILCFSPEPFVIE
jgi:hypothetical protein